MEANTEISATETEKAITIVIPSKKIQINNLDHELAKDLVENKDKIG